MIVRSETPADHAVISEVTIAAFADHPFSNHTEQFIVNALRRANVLTISLVAEIGGRVVGHIAFSPIRISDGSTDWYGLGPVSVIPELQRRGIGTALIHEGISRLKEMGAQGCALVGDPDYYTRFGFRNDPGLIQEGIPQKYFLVMPFHGHIPKGKVAFHEAFLAVG